MAINQNNIVYQTEPWVMFVDMNCYFARCEQQVNYYLRGRPVGVCVYTGKYGCVISPSVEAKQKGVKTGMRLTEAMQICPDLVPLETHPDRYREFHLKIIAILKRYADEVIPKSIDEAVINFQRYKLVYKDLSEVGRKIKQDIYREVGNWMSCSIGIAPNAFLAKLASDMQKPDGLVEINPANIDEKLASLKLEHLPGISHGMKARLNKAGIYTPLELRYASPSALKLACKSITGLYWHYRLNFAEVDLAIKEYKSMQSMRQISADQRKSIQTLHDILVSLCMSIERRMVRRNLFGRHIFFFVQYKDGRSLKFNGNSERPVQDGMEIMEMVRSFIHRQEEADPGTQVINREISALGVGIHGFVSGDNIQYSLFDNRLRKDSLRRTLYDLKARFGKDKLMKAAQLQEGIILKDAIGFGSVKDYWTE